MANNIYYDNLYKWFNSSGSKKLCIFISYKKEDISFAKAISDYLINVWNINTYLDENDYILQEAVSSENDKKIVDSVNNGISCCTHLLCIITDKTKLSWWVPYEIAKAEDRKLEIASIRIKDIDDIPSFLKLHDDLKSINELDTYLSAIVNYNKSYYFDQSKYEQRLRRYIF